MTEALLFIPPSITFIRERTWGRSYLKMWNAHGMWQMTWLRQGGGERIYICNTRMLRRNALDILVTIHCPARLLALAERWIYCDAIGARL